MDNCTISTTFNDDDAYAIEMDADCIGVDYDVVDDYQHQLDEIIKQDTDILFE